MKTVLFAIAAAITLVTASSANATSFYTDSDGVVWAIEGPPVGNWRPFANAAQMCPTHHVLAEHRKLFAGFNATRQQFADAKARDVQTMHMKCLDTPAPLPPAPQAQGPMPQGQGPMGPPPRMAPQQQSMAPPSTPPRRMIRPDPYRMLNASDEESM